MLDSSGVDLVSVAEGRVGLSAPPAVMKSVLDYSGIRCVLEIESPYPAAAVGLGSIAPSYRLLVHREDEHVARELLARTETYPADEVADEYAPLRRGLAARGTETNPRAVLGGVAITLAILAICDLVFGWGMWWALLPLTVLAAFAAWRS